MASQKERFIITSNLKKKFWTESLTVPVLAKVIEEGNRKGDFTRETAKEFSGSNCRTWKDVGTDDGRIWEIVT